MTNEAEEEKESSKNSLMVLMGLLVGSIAGTITVLLLAPQSGKDTRMQIREKGVDLRTQTSKMMDDKIKQARTTVVDLKNSGQQKIKELKQSALDLADEKLGS